ncbi:MAG: ATP-binding cassette domain-containing protein [Alphaproteobacteria bacterium]|nr:ATP-binding cassette domain-containing protein [Alphaproteobacteria bacterium]
MFEVRQICKAFGGNQVVKNISFTLEKGERRVLLGPNGAGKTTIFNLLAGTIPVDSGDILLEGKSIISQSVAMRANAGLARSYQKNNLFEALTMRENLVLAATASQGKASSLRDSFLDKAVMQIVIETAEQVGLIDLLDMQVKHASYGNRRQLEVGIALASRPRLLLMDEPTSGVGPAMIEGFQRLLHDLPKDLTIIIIEHDMDIAFSIADKITVINFGEIVFEGTPQQTKGNKTVRDIYLGDWDKNASA